MLSEIVEKWGGRVEAPMDLYTDVFHLGEGYLQSDGESSGKFKANPVILGKSGDRMHRKILFEDTFRDTLEEFCTYDWAFVSGCTYFGRSNSAERQSKLYAMIFDLDGVTEDTLNNFFSGAIVGGAYPIPQHIVMSGHGVHLYYVFEEPIDLYPNVKTQLKELKYALTGLIWNQYTSTDKHVQYQGINQAFRVPGSKAKFEVGDAIVTAYLLNQTPTTVEELNEFVDEDSRVDTGKKYRESTHTLAEAKKLYPEWYQRVVVDGDTRQWNIKPDLYEWWLRKISKVATFGHRNFCVMCLAIFAAKCNIYDVDKVRADAMTLLPHFNSLNPSRPFTEDDVDSALECLDGRYVTFPRADIAKLSNIDIPRNKRNGRKRPQHIAMVNATRKMRRDVFGEDEYKNSGRPRGSGTKADEIRAYAAEHPGVSQRKIATALGVSKTTVNKWLKPGWREEWERQQFLAEKMKDPEWIHTIHPVPIPEGEMVWTPEAKAVMSTGSKPIGLTPDDFAKVMTGSYDPGEGNHTFVLVRDAQQGRPLSDGA